MSKVIVSGVKSLGKDARKDIEIFNVNMTPLEVKEALMNHEQKIADIKMGRFQKEGRHD